MFKLIFALFIYAVSSLCLMKIFVDEGKAGGPAWIPIWRVFILLDILGFNRYWFIALVIPVVSQIFAIILMYSMAKKYFNYNKKAIVVMTIILWLLPPIGLFLVAYRKNFAKYIG